MNQEEPLAGSHTFHELLDLNYLDSLYRGDAQNAHYIFGLYLEELPGTVTQISQAMAKKDKIALFEILHKTKTSFSFVGLTYITGLMEKLEQQCADATDTAALEPGVSMVLAEISRTEAIIKEEHIKLTAYIKSN
jgi:HPt (histidine-containing phosphotransfer) domain-containing protein